MGTTLKWYDFFIYATAAGLVFAQLFFEPVGAQIALLLAFASVGISFGPLGAFLADHFGDQLGRRAVLVITLLMMGGATSLIGLLPTYESIGVADRPGSDPGHRRHDSGGHLPRGYGPHRHPGDRLPA